MTRYTLDPTYRRFDRVVVGGSPPRLFRLGAAGRGVVECIERGVVLPAGHEPLTDRLLDAGVIHPRPDVSPFSAADVTVVVPAYGEVPACLPLAGATDVIVVDDASVPPLAAAGVTVVRREVNGGPAAARNTGLDLARTPLVAFVDSDLTLPDGWLDALRMHFADERVALVAPRVAAAPGRGVLAVYERTRSPLDMGALPGRVQPGTRVSYVPAAVIVCRRAVVDAVGGFDAARRVGEDVDLVWRLAEQGWRCRYEPAVVARHRTRRTLVGWITQRFRYGTSAAALERRHPGLLAPARLSARSAAPWLLLVARRPLASIAMSVGVTLAQRRRLAGVPTCAALRLILVGHLGAGRQLAAASTRAWMPVTLATALSVRRARLPLGAAVLAVALASWAGGDRRLDPLRYGALHLLDDAAYCAGLWWGAARARSFAALTPASS